jgi:hypothetical protein
MSLAAGRGLPQKVAGGRLYFGGSVPAALVAAQSSVHGKFGTTRKRKNRRGSVLVNGSVTSMRCLSDVTKKLLIEAALTQGWKVAFCATGIHDEGLRSSDISSE